MNGTTLTAMDLYCGSGAVTESLKSEGFRVIAAVDLDPISCETYRLNHPEVHLAEKDIRSVYPANLKKTLKFESALDLLVVCAPCQPFSSQNRKRSDDDPRADLILQCLKFVRTFKPKIIFFENVPGIVNSDSMTLLRKRLKQEGYCLGEPRSVDAADCGVPQRRERCIVVAAKTQAIVDKFYSSIKIHPRATVREAIGGLNALESGEKDPDDPLHFARNHEPIVLERLQYIKKDGGSRNTLPEELELKCHKGRPNDFPDVYGRMKWDDVAPTLTTGCTDLTKGRFAHPRDDRAITLREAALLQSFPPGYQFAGNSGQVAQQIGNAVPVKMATSLAPGLIEAIKATRLIENLNLSEHN